MSADPAMSQWQQRFDAANVLVQRATATRNPQAVRAAYEQLRQVQMARPGQGASQGRPQGVLSSPQSPPAPGGIMGAFGRVSGALSQANAKAR